MEQEIVTQQQDGIFEIILNRPKKRNALRAQTLDAIARAMQHAETLAEVRVVLIRGEGKNFSVGLDFETMGGMPELLGDDWRHKGHAATRAWQIPIQRIQDSPLPTIALLHSYTLGAGFELALGCDLRIAADYTIISLEEAKLGIIPDAGGTTRLTHLVGAARAKEMIFTGRRIDAETALNWGLVNQVVPKDDLGAAGRKLAEEIMSCAPLAVSAAKRAINAIEGAPSGLYHEMVEQYPLFHTQDVQEGVQSVMERRTANWQGR
ncbi:MAG: enoyl-CoA hydratase/isomerase family protein [Anaerolineales bacterium]